MFILYYNKCIYNFKFLLEINGQYANIKAKCYFYFRQNTYNNTNNYLCSQ